VPGLSPARSTTAAPPHPQPSAGVAPIHLPAPGWERPADRLRMVPTFTAVRSTGSAPGSTPAASPRLRRRPSPWPPSPCEQYRTRSSPPEMRSGCAPPTSPHPPGWSWRCLKRRNNTGSSRIPPRLAHQARPIRQSWADPTLSRLLPPSPATPGSGCPQLHPAATTARQRRSLTSIRYSSASWRTARSNGPRRFPTDTSGRSRDAVDCTVGVARRPSGVPDAPSQARDVARLVRAGSVQHAVTSTGR
jgi:hypothetical protein